VGSRLRRALLSSILACLAAAVLIALPQLGPDPVQAAPTAEAHLRLRIVFPVQGRVWYSNNFGACRASCRRRHEGVDIMGHKMERLVAAADGRITVFRHAPQGNYLTITTKGGWSFNYVHLNNDRPGTDDGAQLPPVRLRRRPAQRQPGKGRPVHRLHGRQRQRRGLRPAPALRDPQGLRLDGQGGQPVLVAAHGKEAGMSTVMTRMCTMRRPPLRQPCPPVRRPGAARPVRACRRPAGRRPGGSRRSARPFRARPPWRPVPSP